MNYSKNVILKINKTFVKIKPLLKQNLFLCIFYPVYFLKNKALKTK